MSIRTTKAPPNFHTTTASTKFSGVFTVIPDLKNPFQPILIDFTLQNETTSYANKTLSNLKS